MDSVAEGDGKEGRWYVMPRWEGEAMFVEKKVYAERQDSGKGRGIETGVSLGRANNGEQIIWDLYITEKRPNSAGNSPTSLGCRLV